MTVTELHARYREAIARGRAAGYADGSLSPFPRDLEGHSNAYITGYSEGFEQGARVRPC